MSCTPSRIDEEVREDSGVSADSRVGWVDGGNPTAARIVLGFTAFY